jgi:hypothetical protein
MNGKLLIIVVTLVFSLESYSQDIANVSIIGTGDIMLVSNYPSETKLSINDGKDLLSNVKTILASADVTFGNLEGCFFNSGRSQKSSNNGCYYFRMPDRYVERLPDADADVVLGHGPHAVRAAELYKDRFIIYSMGTVISSDNGNITFIHACNRGVVIENLNESAYYKSRYVTGRRIITENS